MPKMTVHVPDELLKSFKEQFPEINVAEVVRNVITRRVRELKKFEELKAKGVI